MSLIDERKPTKEIPFLGSSSTLDFNKRESESIEAMTKAFIKSGGKVTKCDPVKTVSEGIRACKGKLVTRTEI